MRMRAALRWIDNSGHFELVFQSRSDQDQIAAKVPGHQDQNGEALILGTCLTLNRKHPTILLTEDEQLGIKARAIGVTVSSCAEMKEKVAGEEVDCCPISDQVFNMLHACFKVLH